MSAHRFRELLTTTSPVVVTRSTTVEASNCALGGFVPFPCPLFAAAPFAQQQMQEIYRIAWEQTQSQLRPRRRAVPQFSVN